MQFFSVQSFVVLELAIFPFLVGWKNPPLPESPHDNKTVRPESKPNYGEISGHQFNPTG